MKFDVGASTLSLLAQKTSSANDDLTALVRQLIQVAEPLEGKFSGQAKATFDNFKAHVDEITHELNSALGSVLSGVQGQDRAFNQGDQQTSEAVGQMMGRTDFDAARFAR